jgi:hypothetical protein
MVNGDAATFDLDIADGALGGGAAGGEDGIGQGAEGTDAIRAGADGLTDDEDLDGAQGAEVGVEREVAVDLAELLGKKVVELAVRHAGDMQCSDTGQGDGTGAIDGEAHLLVDLASQLDVDFIAGAEDIARADGDVIHGREGTGDVGKERSTVNGQPPPGSRFDHLLEFGARVL